MLPEKLAPLDNPIPPNHRRMWRMVSVVAVMLIIIAAGTCFAVYMIGKRSLPPSGGWYFFARVELPVPLFLQGDPAWGKDQSGSGDYTLSQVGCAITSSAMVMKFYGVDTDPKRLNVFLRGHDGFDENNDLRWEGPAALAPGRVRRAYEDLPSYYLIDSNLYHGNPVIVRLHLASGWTHFVVIMGKQGFNYLIRDPSSAGLRKGVYPLRELGSNIEALRFYERLPDAG